MEDRQEEEVIAGVAPGAVVELVNPRGAPLRAWVASVSAAHGGGGSMVAELAPIGLSMLGLTDGGEVEVRALHTGVLTTQIETSGTERS